MTERGLARRRLVQASRAAALAGSLVVLASTVPVAARLTGAGVTCAAAGYQHHAAVVVTHLHVTPSPVRVCVGFDEDQITGHQLLDRSGVEWGGSGYYGSQGTAVCQVDNEPAHYPPDCLQSGTPYWSIWSAHYGQAWAFARFGIDGVTIRDGDAEGFRYADDSSQAAPDSPAGVCPPPAAPPTAAPPPGGQGPASASSTPARSTTANPPAGSPAPPAPAPAGQAALASPADPGPSVSPHPSSSPSTWGTPRGSVGGSPASRSDPWGWVAAAAAAVGLSGTLAFRLLSGRLRS